MSSTWDIPAPDWLESPDPPWLTLEVVRNAGVALRRGIIPWLRSTTRRVAIYGWFLVVLHLVLFWNPAFLIYEGPSVFLSLAKTAGFFVLMAMGMLPVAVAVEGIPREGERLSNGDLPPLILLALVLVLVCLAATVAIWLFALLPISWISPELVDAVGDFVWP